MPATLPNNARCLHCSYLLRGLSENKCPECGGKFDPDDTASFWLPRVPKLASRWAQSPSRAVFPIVVLLTAYYFLFVPPTASAETLTLWLGVTITLALALDAVLRFGARKVLFAITPDDDKRAQFRKSDRTARMPFVWLMVGAVALSLLVGINLRLMIKFQISRPALEREVTSIRTQVPPGMPGFFPVDKRIGLFRVNAVRVDPGDNFTFWLDGPTIIYTESTLIPDSYWLGPHWRMKRFW